MSEYQPSARRFRPQSFREVVGQEHIITTLKNAVKFQRLAHAYLFCGSRGTGKTTLARLFAKALNCIQPDANGEPCNMCTSCKEIMAGSSLDVLEIDGASHRGIEDIRKVNETIGYAAAAGGYKIYLIDEVHMLTKEAFNALLKTLEEPPAKVKFLFATTEPHKIPATILSRCQRFNLGRIPTDQMVVKLQRIAQALEITAQDEALRLLALRAEGGLRDAESLFDQILAFGANEINVEATIAILGLTPHNIYFAIDHAGQAGNFIKAFEITEKILSEGRDLHYFIDGLIAHLRQILLCRLSGMETLNDFSNEEKQHYMLVASFYSQEQCLDLIEYLLEKQQQIRFSSFGRFLIEAIILHVMRSHFRLPIEYLVRRLSELEQAVDNSAASNKIMATETLVNTSHVDHVTTQVDVEIDVNTIGNNKVITETSAPAVSVIQTPTIRSAMTQMISELPSTTVAPPYINTHATNSTVVKTEKKRPAHAYDTLFQFSAVELEGRLKKHH